MENNIFEGAKFGDKFLTRSGRLALYLHPCTKIFGQDCGHHLVIFTDADTYASNGKLWKYKDNVQDNESDIVSRYQNPFEQVIKETTHGMTNKELRDLLSQYPDDAMVAIECCDVKKMTYNQEDNSIRID